MSSSTHSTSSEYRVYCVVFAIVSDIGRDTRNAARVLVRLSDCYLIESMTCMPGGRAGASSSTKAATSIGCPVSNNLDQKTDCLLHIA